MNSTVDAFKARSGVTWERAETSLEDVFIRLMQAVFKSRRTGIATAASDPRGEDIAWY